MKKLRGFIAPGTLTVHFILFTHFERVSVVNILSISSSLEASFHGRYLFRFTTEYSDEYLFCRMRGEVRARRSCHLWNNSSINEQTKTNSIKFDVHNVNDMHSLCKFVVCCCCDDDNFLKANEKLLRNNKVRGNWYVSFPWRESWSSSL